MKSILDPLFRYRPSFATDLSKTFERIRREKEAAFDAITAPSGEQSIGDFDCIAFRGASVAEKSARSTNHPTLRATLNSTRWAYDQT